MPLKSLEINNFQSHRNSKLIFCPGINAIIGQSDSGKSAVIRALNALLFRGPFYIRSGETEGHISITTDRKSDITRCVKTKGFYCTDCKKSSEKINCPSCGQLLSQKVAIDVYTVENDPFSKFGAKIPDELAKQIGIRSVCFGDYEENLNLRTQHQDMFFIGESYTGGARNKILSSLITDSDKIDTVIKKFNSDLQRDKTLIDEFTGNIKDAEEKIEDQKDTIEEIKQLKARIEKNQSEIEDKKNRLITLEKLETQIQKLGSYLRLSDKVALCNPFIDKINKKIVTMNEKSSRLLSLNKVYLLRIKYEVLSKNIIQNLEKNIGQVESLQRTLETYQKLDYQISDNRVQEGQKKAQGVSLGLEIDDLKKQIKAFFAGKVICPLTHEPYCSSCKTILMDKCEKGEE